MPRFILQRLALAALLGLTAFCAGLWAEPPQAAEKPDSAAVAEEPTPEIPAPVYVLLGLIRDPAVQSELKLSAKQADDIGAAIADVDEQFWQLRDVPLKTSGPQLEVLHHKLREGLDRTLTNPQRERLGQIILQVRGWKGLTSTDLSEQLKLSSDQVTRLRTAVNEAIKERDASEKDNVAASESKRAAARSKLQKAQSRKIAEILTTKQQTEYSKLLGKPFDTSRVTPVGCVAPELRDVTAWINSEPLELKRMRGKVVVVHFWAFGCINCIRNLPHYQGWYETFDKSDVVIIGIQTPETESERKLDNLKRNVLERKIEYPVVFDADSANWKAWGNNMWPSVYLIDKKGRVRNWWYGELNWEGAKGEEFMRKRIAELIAEK